MQYKIPVQIENEDPIFLGLSLRQLAIMMVGFWIAYNIFQTFAPRAGWEIALLITSPIVAITIAVAVFKAYEMTFIPFVLAALRLFIYHDGRYWQNWIDSFQSIDIGFITNEQEKKQENIDMQEKANSLQDLQEKLKKI